MCAMSRRQGKEELALLGGFPAACQSIRSLVPSSTGDAGKKLKLVYSTSVLLPSVVDQKHYNKNNTTL